MLYYFLKNAQKGSEKALQAISCTRSSSGSRRKQEQQSLTHSDLFSPEVGELHGTVCTADFQ